MIEGDVGDMHFSGCYPHNRTIYFMQFLDLEQKLSTQNNVVIEIIPTSGSSQTGSGDGTERMEVEAVNDHCHAVEHQ